MKKTFILIFSTTLILLSLMFFDYTINSKEIKVSVYTVNKRDIQESFFIKGKVEKSGNINFINGKTAQPLEIKEGAQASVYINGKYYDGYLKNLDRESPTLYSASVSVVSDEELSGNGEAFVYGKINDGVILVPRSCIFRDEKGNDCVMVIINDFCAKRKVSVGKISIDNSQQISEGLFENEKVVLNPEGLHTGNKVYYD